MSQDKKYSSKITVKLIGTVGTIIVSIIAGLATVWASAKPAVQNRIEIEKDQIECLKKDLERIKSTQAAISTQVDLVGAVAWCYWTPEDEICVQFNFESTRRVNGDTIEFRFQNQPAAGTYVVVASGQGPGNNKVAIGDKKNDYFHLRDVNGPVNIVVYGRPGKKN